MLFLDDVKNWLKQFGIAQNYYVSKLDSKREKSLGVYQRKTPSAPIIAIGQDSSYEIKPISLLLHWNKNAVETEKAAYELYKQLRAVSSFEINGTRIQMLLLLQSEPIDVGTDSNGVYERVIEFDLYYERND